ncbi:ATP phosphoribosyltransferase [Temperatibacter marinus]|uniref:ATP phosphoribosyltransferase n=1 Tax=Temperatibacter marinus TaxID=1456591 RepID=A0AA52EK96_9PROT|nr:ATP phosphoribosyltransferase [Temperatibacter marinus]WND04039.1 ATP phosphoribosyltransferase [Temperatibacter marinus]
MELTAPLVLALPKGRILDEVMPLVRAAGIEPEAAFDDPKSRALKFDTNIPGLSIIRVRAFDAATFVAFGAAHLGVVGNDVLREFDYDDLYSPLDLGIGYCRLSVALPNEMAQEIKAAGRTDSDGLSHVRVATKYPNITRQFYAEKGVQAEVVKLNGAMELAPALQLTPRIVDLVSTGGTLKANGLQEVDTLMEITSRLVVNRSAFKIRPKELSYWTDKFRDALASLSSKGA